MSCFAGEIATGLLIAGSVIVIGLAMFSDKDKSQLSEYDRDMKRTTSRRVFCKTVLSSIDLNKKNDDI